MDVFDDWNHRFPRGEDTNHRTGPLTEDSVFLFQSVTAPLPSGAHWGSWSWYKNALQLRAHLLYVVLPDMAATWLNDSGSGLYDARVPLSDTVANATGDRVEDIRFFEGLAHDLEPSVGANNRDLAVELQDLARRFTARFGRTPTWDLKLEVFTSVVEAGDFLFDRSPESITNTAGEGIERADWHALCERAPVDADISHNIEGLFENAFEL